MRYFDFLQDRASSLLIDALGFVLVLLVLWGAGMALSIIEVVAAILIVITVGRYTIEYVRRRDFWQRLHTITQDGAGALVAQELVEEPNFLEGELAWDALDVVTQESRKQIDVARTESIEYRDYIETWVHEAKTPIAAAQLACENEPGTLSVRVSKELDRIDGYVEQALFYARASSLERDYVIKEVSISSLVQRALRAHKRSCIDAGVAIELGNNLDFSVFADAKWMVFVLGQVLENAVKYRSSESQVRPTITITAQQAHVGKAHEYVELTIQDNGRGISAADLPRIFDKGFVGDNGRSQQNQKSTGIGLYLVQRLCTKMGIGVSAYSQEHAGTRMVFRFPTNRMYLVDASTTAELAQL